MKIRFAVSRCCCDEQPAPPTSFTVEGVATAYYSSLAAGSPIFIEPAFVFGEANFGASFNTVTSPTGERLACWVNFTFLNFTPPVLPVTSANFWASSWNYPGNPPTFPEYDGTCWGPFISASVDPTRFARGRISYQPTTSPGADPTTVGAANGLARSASFVDWSISVGQESTGNPFEGNALLSPDLTILVNEIFQLTPWNTTAQTIRVFIDDNNSDQGWTTPGDLNQWGAYACIGYTPNVNPVTPGDRIQLRWTV